jgi:hypothetical protein
MRNLPDDYGMHWRKCYKHNLRFHASDGACDECINESVPRMKDGDPIDGCICITYVEGHIQVSDTYREGWMILDKGRTYGISLFEGELLGASIYKDKEQAIANGAELILVIPS